MATGTKTLDRDLGMKDILKQVKILRGKPFVKAGFPEEANRPRKDGDPLSNAEIATVHEFGSTDGRIPERSFRYVLVLKGGGK